MTTAAIIIRGSSGDFTAHAETGEVLSCLPEDYDFIRWMDITEYKRWLETNGIEWSGEIDILDIGYWTEKGKYVPAEQASRDEWLRIRREG